MIEYSEENRKMLYSQPGCYSSLEMNIILFVSLLLYLDSIFFSGKNRLIEDGALQDSNKL